MLVEDDSATRFTVSELSFLLLETKNCFKESEAEAELIRICLGARALQFVESGGKKSMTIPERSNRCEETSKESRSSEEDVAETLSTLIEVVSL